MIEFLEFMNVRKTSSSNILLYMFSDSKEYKSYVKNYINLLKDLCLIDTTKKQPDKTIIDLKTGVKIVILLTRHIDKLYGYRYYDFRLFGEFTYLGETIYANG